MNRELVSLGRLPGRLRPLAVAAATLWVVAASCGGNEPVRPPVPTTIVKLAGDGQDGIAGDAVAIDPVVEVRDEGGAPMSGVSVRFTTSSGGATSDTTVTTGTDGRAGVAWLLGPSASSTNTLRASVGVLSATFAATAATPAAGTSYFGRNGYVEYIAGDLPLIISAPHGGTLTPVELPNRTGTGITTVRDTYTEELARTIGNVFQTRIGGRPHLVIMRLHRTKIDANREVSEAAQGHRLAERAWVEWHAYIEAAKHALIARHGTGFYIDLHGHGHTIPRLELGYLLGSTTLALPDATLDAPAYENQSSIRTLSQVSPASFPELLRGSRSLGALFEAEGIPAVPSPTAPNPGTAPYFDGGYNTARHGARDGGPISGVQIESHYTGIRDTQAAREQFAIALVRVWEQFRTGATAPVP